MWLKSVRVLDHQPDTVHWCHIVKNTIKLRISLLQASVRNIYGLRVLRLPVMLNCFSKRNQRTEEGHHAQIEIVVTVDSKVRYAKLGGRG